MDRLLRDNLMALLTAYIEAVGGKESTIAQRAAGDWRFFKRLGNPSVTFTIRKYEETLAWFAAHWPVTTPWPQGVPKPNDTPVLADQSGFLSVEARL